MNRRDVLRRTVALAGVGTLAGCLNEGGGDDGGGGGSDGGDGGGTTTEPTPSITDQSIATQNTSCLSENGVAASVAADSLVVTVTGTIEAPDPCHEATIVNATYDAEANALALSVGTESGDGMCQDCVGGVEYEATVTFDGALPASTTVDHEGTDGATIVTETEL